MKYNDLDAAVRACLSLIRQLEETMTDSHDSNKPIIYLGKTDLSSAFRVLPLMVKCFCWLVFKALDPKDGKFKYFVDKCLPFGTSISCALYQAFSDSLRFIIEYRTGPAGRELTNYLDDSLFLALAKFLCNQVILKFLDLCEELNIPVAIEKTEWASEMVIFLGILLNGQSLTLSIPLDKKEKALKLLNDLTGKKKATVKQLQALTGYLNFLTKVIVPGGMFTRRMYAKYGKLEGTKLKNGEV